MAVITEGVALEGIDELAPDALKPRLVADHGSPNIAKYPRTGNARTERVMGTLKCEEINPQDEYESEEEGKKKITATIHDYNFFRPNHRKICALEKRNEARQFTQDQSLQP